MRPTSFEQVEILHVAGADLDDVDVVLQKRLEHPHIHELGDDRQPVGVGGGAQHFEPVDAFSLKRVRARARLERAAAHQPRAAGFRSGGGRFHLRHGLHRAWAGDDLHGIASDRNAGHVDDGVRLVPFAGDHLVLLDDVHRLLDAGHRVEHFRLERALVADRADQRPLGSARDVYRQAVRPDLRFDCLDLVRLLRRVA